METETYLQTERLLLRRFAPSDAEYLIGLDSDPEVMRYLTGGSPTAPEVIRNEILPRFLHSNESLDGFGVWAVLCKRSGEFLGWFSFLRTAYGPALEAVLGYRFCRKAWGQGYATEGALVLLQRGFTELGVERVSATTYSENLASRRVMEKLGMQLRRTFRITAPDQLGAGTFDAGSAGLFDGDDVEYVLERFDWECNQLAQL